MRRWETVGRVARDDSRAYLQQFDRMFECVYPVREVLDRALDLSERYSLSHWDSLLLGACCHVGVETLYTEDLDENTSYAGLSVVNPFS